MAVLNKLLDLLEQVKTENPELANRVTMASEVLNIKNLTEESPEPESEPEEAFDDSYIAISEEETKRVDKLINKLNSALHEYGSYMRDHEVLNLDHLERIENLRNSQERLLELLKEKYKVNPQFSYTLVKDKTHLVFVKKEV